MDVTSIEGYRRQALAVLGGEGWEHPLSDAIVMLGHPAFVDATGSGVASDAALQQALASGRRQALVKLYADAIEDGATPELAFRGLVALTRQNALRAGGAEVFFPRPWVEAAAAAVIAVVELGATPEQQVLVGLRVFAAAGAAAASDMAIREGEQSYDA